ncbi:hypothetical protein HMI54_011727 [Coelomomyces lativittatus]|nr:hypothetical protein HMI54_011727 [Coelomomyces lativittatus]KAJ1499861.1 hypothetical protein HMI56_004166 [Coelomomyces lativittatus]KAJ1513569.1 hypothetical protein HMI55_005434 [Coelomomyces lativittatus]
MKKSLPPPIHSPSSLHLDSINSALLPPSLPTSKSSTTSTTTIPSSSSSTKFMPPHPVTLNLSPIPPMFLSNIEKSAAALYRCKRAVFITGAGISVNAGIPVCFFLLPFLIFIYFFPFRIYIY